MLQENVGDEVAPGSTPNGQNRVPLPARVSLLEVQRGLSRHWGLCPVQEPALRRQSGSRGWGRFCSCPTVTAVWSSTGSAGGLGDSSVRAKAGGSPDCKPGFVALGPPESGRAPTPCLPAVSGPTWLNPAAWEGHWHPSALSTFPGAWHQSTGRGAVC